MFKQKYLSSSIAMLAALGMSQAVAQPQSEEFTEEIVVTGIRASLDRATDIKRESMHVVDSVVAEDIGKLPDYNVIESLQRVSGVQVTDRGAGEVSTISVRGLTDVSTTINGRTIFTASGRAVALADVPSTLVGRIDVIKSRSAQHFENGLAGQIDVQTRRPFDFDGARVSLAGRLVHQEQNSETDPVVSALFSNRWETGAGEFGALFNVSFAQTNYRDQTVTAGAQVPFVTENPPEGFTPLQRIFPNMDNVAEDPIWQPGLDAGLPTAPGSTLDINGVPTEYYLSRDAIFNFDFTGERERPAANISLQFAPNDTSEYVFEAFYNGFRNDTFNSLMFSFVDWWGALGPNPENSFELFEGSNVIRSRTVGAPFLFGSGDFTKQETDSFLYALGGEWEFGSNFRLESELVYQDSDFQTEFIALRTTGVRHQVSANFDGVPGWRVADNPDTPNVDEGDLTDPAQWDMGEMFENAFESSGSAVTFTADAEYDTNWGFLHTLNFGIRYDDRDASERERDQDAAPCNAVNEGNIPDCQLGNHPDLAHINSGFFDGNSDVHTEWLVADGPFLVDNRTRFLNLYDLDPNQPLVETFSISEENTALYLTGDFEAMLGGLLLDGQLGFRYVDVQTDMVFTNEQSQEQTGDSNDNSEFLTDLMLRFHLTDDLLLRFSFGQTLRMPNFADLNPNINFIDDVTGIGFGTANGGNPNLEPTTSDNLDLSLEWYFADSSSAYITLFERDIEGLVVPFRSLIIEDLPDFNANRFVLQAPENASDGSLEGVELGLIYFPDNLPGALDGLGIQASFTFLDSEQTIPVTDPEGNVIGSDVTPIFGVSDTSYSVTLAYERPSFDTRLSYVWRDDFLNDNEAPLFANPIGRFGDSEASLDFQFSYNVTDEFTITFDATNLTEEIYQNRYGGSELHTFATQLFSRTFALGARYSF